ncbi:WbqC family protein [Kaistella palustris]|uniref:WbqC family protein n=1 Tax=Kaistella palustris TaxID=493376 RepID=UPI00041E58F4|nr:WbqC family protein [Kaistella palustris]
MKVAIMQPYLFPYIGYFQLIAAVDKFVVYDDVNFIKGGWINRNNILVNKKSNLFTVPLDNSSSFFLINETKINLKLYSIWKIKFLRTIEQSYKKAPFFNEVYSLIANVLDNYEGDLISKLAVASIKSVCEHLKIQTEIIATSETYNNKRLSGQERVLDICSIENATYYINPIGGLQLYSKEIFKSKNIELNFIKSYSIAYKQFDNKFVSWLSIIDTMMFNSVEEINIMLDKYELV